MFNNKNILITQKIGIFGNIRDEERLMETMKQIPATEYNPMECIKINIHSAKNVIKAAIANKVASVIARSTE